jgi:Co/Zn/Cd efflux system component
MNHLKNGFRFGYEKDDSFVTMTVKSVLLLVPGMILGHFLDRFIHYLETKEVLGKSMFLYVFIQTVVNIFIIFLLHYMYHNYTSEFQRTLPGMYFSGLFFGLQVNYVQNIQQLLGGNN